MDGEEGVYLDSDWERWLMLIVFSPDYDQNRDMRWAFRDQIRAVLTDRDRLAAELAAVTADRDFQRRQVRRFVMALPWAENAPDPASERTGGAG